MENNSFGALYRLPEALKYWIIFFPFVVFSAFGLAMSFEATQDYAFALVKDDNVVDWFTFCPAFLGGILGIRLALRLRGQGKPTMIWLFYFVFALGLIFIGGEETSWGQNFVHFRTPFMFERWNVQDEVTLHNLDGIQDRNHFLRLAFGVGGLSGLLAWRSERFRDLALPRVLAVWFWLIALKSVLDIFNKPFAASEMPAYIVSELSEVIEMLIAIAGLLYLWLNGRRLASYCSQSMFI